MLRYIRMLQNREVKSFLIIGTYVLYLERIVLIEEIPKHQRMLYLRYIVDYMQRTRDGLEDIDVEVLHMLILKKIQVHNEREKK
uniref:Uncharacterized protein n=1 Tax=Lactuca sativa TaxID=4236 RepID=A0A9R1V567_LACSA|nr:hypothetical protein LSAT_V11C600319130 [Lactuca sativa]